MGNYKKRGKFSFSLIVIIIFLLIIIIFFSGYLKKTSMVILESESERFDIDGGYVFLYIDSHERIDNVLSSFTRMYSDYEKKGKEIYFIYKDGGEIYLLGYNITSEGSFMIGGMKAPIKNYLIYREILHLEDGKVNVSINGKDYSFPVRIN